MTHPQIGNALSPAPWLTLRGFLRREWPYLLVLVLAFFGIAFTSVTRARMTIYWVALAPLIGLICVVTRWREIAASGERARLIWTQVLHWGAVVLAMQLMFVTGVERMMNAGAGGLAELTLLALGTFTAGVHIAAWRICLVGLILGAGVPGIAWLEQSALLLALAGLVVAALVAPFLWHRRKQRTQEP